MKTNSNFQGEVVKMISPMGDATAFDTFDYEDNFYPADGFMNESEGGNDNTFSNFDVGAVFGVDKKERRRRRKLREDLKKQEAATKSKLASGLSDKTGDIALANAIKEPEVKSNEQKGMSTTTKVALGVGVVAVLGIVGFVIYKKSKGGKR